MTVVGLGYGSALLVVGPRHEALDGVAGRRPAGRLVGGRPRSAGSRCRRAPSWATSRVWPLEPDWLAIVGVVLAVVLVVARACAGCRAPRSRPPSAAPRWSGQMRFAVTLQDLRTVLVLRRQLSQEHPRSTPWIPALRRPHPEVPGLAPRACAASPAGR